MKKMNSPDYLNLEGDGFPDPDACDLWDRYGKVVQLTGNLLEAEGFMRRQGISAGSYIRVIPARFWPKWWDLRPTG